MTSDQKLVEGQLGERSFWGSLLFCWWVLTVCGNIAGSVRGAVPGAWCFVRVMPGKGKESRWLLVGDEVAPSASSVGGGRIRRTLPDAKLMGKGRFLAAASGRGVTSWLVMVRWPMREGSRGRNSITNMEQRERKVLRWLLVFGC